MTKLYLIRHAEAEGNLYRIVQGQDNSNLTDRGWRQVQALERRFSSVPIHAVYTSDLYRTCATASAVYLPKGLEPYCCKALREIYVGSWEQRTWGDIARTDIVQMDHFMHNPALWHIDGAEAPRQVLERVLRAVKAIARRHDGESVAVVSHGYAIRLLLGHLQGYSLEQMGKTPTGQNTAVSLLEAEGDTLRVVFRDDTTHLKAPEYLAQEPVRRRTDPLEPGLWFEAPGPQNQEALLSLAAGAWKEKLPFDAGRFFEDGENCTTLLGFLRSEPVGFIRFNPRSGEILFACIREDLRRRHFGVQLIGQAVQRSRAAGTEQLFARLQGGHSASDFFRRCGFLPGEGGVWVKDIRFRPEFLDRPTID